MWDLAGVWPGSGVPRFWCLIQNPDAGRSRPNPSHGSGLVTRSLDPRVTGEVPLINTVVINIKPVCMCVWGLVTKCLDPGVTGEVSLVVVVVVVIISISADKALDQSWPPVGCPDNPISRAGDN